MTPMFSVSGLLATVTVALVRYRSPAGTVAGLPWMSALVSLKVYVPVRSLAENLPLLDTGIVTRRPFVEVIVKRP